MTATQPAPVGQARALAEQERHEQEQRDREDLAALQRKQTAAARQRRIDKAARRDPATEALLQDHNALQSTVNVLREQYAALEAKHAQHITAATELAEAHAAVTQERDQLKQQFEAACSARDQAIAELEAARTKKGK